MNIKEIINEIFKNLPKHLRENTVLQKLKLEFIKLTKNNTNVDLELNETIYKKINGIEKHEEITPIDKDTKLIFSFETIDGDEVCFSLSNYDGYQVNFIVSKKINGIYHDIVIEVTISKNKTSCKVTTFTTDEKDFYLSYNCDFYEFDKNMRPIKIPNIAKTKDRDFSDFFGVPIEEARTLRLNFKKNCEYLNNKKIQTSLDTMDDLYFGNQILFAVPFKITDLENYLFDGTFDELGESEEVEEDLDFLEEDLDETYIDEEEDYEEEIDEDEERVKALTTTLKEKLINYLGEDGEFIMSYNLYTNISELLFHVNSLSTKGYIIKKLNKTYTLYYINITNGNLIIFPKKLPHEELIKLYESNPENAFVYGLSDFVEIGTKRTYKKDTN